MSNDKPAPEVADAIRAVGGIVHSDGNIFFGNISQLEQFAAGRVAASPAPVAQKADAPLGWADAGDLAALKNGPVATTIWRDAGFLADPQALYTTPQAPAPTDADADADMFWNEDDSENPHKSIDCFLNDEICNGTGVEVGDEFILLRAISLPKIKIRVTSIDEEACEAEYEVVDAAMAAKDAA